MWILSASLALLSYFAVRLYWKMTEHRVALTTYAIDLLLRPDRYHANAATLRELILREPEAPSRKKEILREKEILRLIAQWAREASMARSGITLKSIAQGAQ